MTGRRGLAGLAVACLLAAYGIGTPQAVLAQPAFPSKPVRIVVPSNPGGPADIVARLVGERLARVWNQPVVIDNKAGASQMIGTEAVARSAPDGYTLLLTPDGPVTINPALFPKLPYDPAKDLSPVAQIVSVPLLLVVNPAVPVATVSELVAHAKANPGKLNFGAGGSTSRMGAEIFKLAAGIDMVHVPYRGSGPMVVALLGNEVQLAFDGITSSIMQVRGGKLRALAVTSPARVASLPDVPTVAESGVAGFEAGTWLGVFVPAGTPKAIVARLNADLAAVLAQPDVAERLVDMGMAVTRSTPEGFAARIAADTDKWGQVIRRAGIKAEQ